MVEKTKAVDGHLTVTGYRLVLGASFPKPKRKEGMVLNSAGLEVPLAPNENLAPNGNFDGLQPDVQYTSIGEIAAAAQPLLSLAEFTGGTWAKPLTGSSGFDRYTCACSIDGSQSNSGTALSFMTRGLPWAERTQATHVSESHF